jgi:DNA repair exonuclease SbcCD ATPase subunit
MLKILALNITINTTDGPYGFSCNFGPRLNIIRGDNSSGKSTLFQSILYGMGMEELIGSRNDKAMQSVLKNEILNDKRIKLADVTESYIQLELSNGQDDITTERYVRSTTRDSKLLRVYYGRILTNKNEQVKSDLMYVHDPGSATDTEFGFFSFFESFLGYELPEMQYNDGGIRKLYLQTIFPAFIIEQKVGWSDFLATTPFFNLRDKEKRAIEFLLKLDSWDIEKKKQEIAQLKQDISTTWDEIYYRITELARRSATEINGIESSPSIINVKDQIFLSYTNNDQVYSLSDYIIRLTNELSEIESRTIPKVSQIAEIKEIELKEKTDIYNSLLIQEDDLNNRKTIIRNSVATIEDRLKQIDDELTHNKHHLKVKTLASEKAVIIATDECPTCGQDISDSLLAKNSTQIPMTIEQNIGYLDAQKSMIRNYLDNHAKEIKILDTQLFSIADRITDLRGTIRSIRRDLVSDDRLPSIEAIEQKIKIKNRVDFFSKTDEEFGVLIDALLKVSDQWSNYLSEQAKLPKQTFSAQDYKKLKMLDDNFIEMLERFDYGSKTLSDLSISKDKLIPVAEGQYNIKYNMRLDSSASDLVRAITAYTFSLYKVATAFDTNHPSLIMLDEPGTQETAIASLKAMLIELQGYKAQSLVFASFKQSDTDFHETTLGLDFKLIRSIGKFIKKIE